jgi:hypothetical protein
MESDPLANYLFFGLPNLPNEGRVARGFQATMNETTLLLSKKRATAGALDRWKDKLHIGVSQHAFSLSAMDHYRIGNLRMSMDFSESEKMYTGHY